MALVLLLFAFGLLGYLIARSQTRDPAEDSAANASSEGLTAQIRDLGAKTTGWFGNLGIGKKPVDLRQWAAEALDLPGDVRAWIMNLSPDEAAAFGQALNQHGKAMDLELASFFSSSSGQTPEQREAYIEAVAVYSRAYRKAKEAQERETAERETAEQKAADQEAMDAEGGAEGQADAAGGEVIEGKLVAEKRLSRRRRGGAPEENAASA